MMELKTIYGTNIIHNMTTSASRRLNTLCIKFKIITQRSVQQCFSPTYMLKILPSFHYDWRFWVHKTSFPPPCFIEVSLLGKESALSRICIYVHIDIHVV